MTTMTPEEALFLLTEEFAAQVDDFAETFSVLASNAEYVPLSAYHTVQGIVNLVQELRSVVADATAP